MSPGKMSRTNSFAQLCCISSRCLSSLNLICNPFLFLVSLSAMGLGHVDQMQIIQIFLVHIIFFRKFFFIGDFVTKLTFFFKVLDRFTH